MNVTKRIMLMIAAVATSTAVAMAGGDLTITQARIYINPGHGSWGPNDRNMATINHAIGDTCGFYESNTNLWKSLKMGATLEKWGVPKANIAYSRVKNGPYPYVSGAADAELYNRNLTEISEECNAFNTDYFISIHSDAATEGSATNLSLLIYNGYSVPAADDANMWEGSRSLEYQQTSRAMAEMLWPILESNGIDVISNKSPRIVGDLTFYYGYNSPADNVNNAAGYLGVLRRNTCNGFLSEGYCHTYQPARHRCLNPDYCGQEGVRLARGVAAWFGWETESTGYIMGAVKDLHEVFSHTLYHPNTASIDIFKPVNNAVVTLYKAGVEVAKYTCDNEYNGVFVFENLEPGNDYTIDVAAEGYKTNFALDEEYGREHVTYTVDAGETTYPIIQLEAADYVDNPTYNYPDPIQEKWLNVATSYEMRQDYVKKPVDVLSGKTLRREVAKGDSLYVLALDTELKPYIYCFNAKTHDLLFEVSTQGVSSQADEYEIMPISDIAFTSDSVLVACNAVKTSYTPTGVLRLYRWARNEDSRAPEGDPVEWFTSSDNYTSGNFVNAITGNTMAVNGRLEKCTVATTAQTTKESGEVRIPLFTISRKGLVGTIRNQDNTHFTTALLGDDYQLQASPYGDDAFVIDGSKTTAFDFVIGGNASAPIYGSQLSTDVAPAAVNGVTFFKYAGSILMVTPTANADGANTGVALYNVTNGLASAELIETTNTGIAATAADHVCAYSGVNGADLSLYVNADGAVSRFTTEDVEQTLYKGVYAYNLHVEDDGEQYVFTFNANDNCLKGGRLIFTDAATGQHIGDIEINNVVYGENRVEVGIHDLPGTTGEVLTWAVEVASNNVTNLRNLLTKEGDYALDRAYATVDNSYRSPNLGTIYVSNYKSDNSDANGVWAYDQDYNRVNTQIYNTPGFCTNTTMGVDAEGNIYVTDNAAANAGLWRANANAIDGGFVQYFEGTNTSGVISNGSAEVAGVATSVAFTGEGSDAKMYAYMKNSAGKYVINIYNIGQADATLAATWGLAPSKVIGLTTTMIDDAQILPVEQGIWVCQTILSVSNTEAQPSLLFVDYDGNITFNQGLLQNKDLLSGAAGSALAVSPDGKMLVLNDENGFFQFYNVAWDGNKPLLTPIYSYQHGIGVTSRRILDGNYLEQMAFDRGGNLVAAGHYLGVFTIPTADNRHVTQAVDTVVSGSSGINAVIADDEGNSNAPVEYFNLQGQRVTNPGQGFYIKRQGNKVEKVVL
ncbi:MAG: N-acetylmuramoyl-L-alanine amidase [Muribaculaceae bacterium]